MFEREMNQKHALPDTLMNQIYHQLSNLNDVAFKDFILQLCCVLRYVLRGYFLDNLCVRIFSIRNIIKLCLLV